jgi:hypothetical protein
MRVAESVIIWIFGKEMLRIDASYLVTVTNRPSIRVAVPRIVRCISYIHADPKGQRRVDKGLPICIAKYFYSITRTGICKNPLHDHYHQYPLLSSIILIIYKICYDTLSTLQYSV